MSKKLDTKNNSWPTSQLRGIIYANCLKSDLLGDSHDPFKPQTNAVLNRLAEAIDKRYSESTWKNWWTGKHPSKNSKLAELEEARRALNAQNNSLKDILEPNSLSTPLLRHLYIQDHRLRNDKELNINHLGGMEYSSNNWNKYDSSDFLSKKRSGALECIDKIATAWEIFTNEHHSKSNHFAVEKSVDDFTNRITPSDLEDIYRHNTFIHSIPKSIRAKYQLGNPYSVLPFLLALGDFLAPMTEREYLTWALDLSSLAAAVITLQSCSSLPDKESIVGAESSNLAWCIAALFWGSYPGEKEATIYLPEREYQPDDKTISLLREAKLIYYFTFENLGIRFETVKTTFSVFSEKTLPEGLDGYMAMSTTGKLCC